MASYLRPRRGKKATAIAQNIILKRGEVFFEAPDSGVGTGAGKIKVGDGTTTYSQLPYFLESGGGGTASNIGFDNSGTGLNSTDIESAIIEIHNNLKKGAAMTTEQATQLQFIYDYISNGGSVGGKKSYKLINLGNNREINMKSILKPEALVNYTSDDFIISWQIVEASGKSKQAGYQDATFNAKIAPNTEFGKTYDPSTGTLTITGGTYDLITYSYHGQTGSQNAKQEITATPLTYFVANPADLLYND